MIRTVNLLMFFLLVQYLTAQVITFRNTYGGTGDDHGRDVEQTADGGYIIAGSTSGFGFGQSDVYLLKIDSTGNYTWSKSYGGEGIDWGMDVEVLNDGFIISGYTNSFGNGGYDFYLIRTDSIGDTLWTKTYGGWDWDIALSVKQTIDGGFILVGETYSYGAGQKDLYIIKTDAAGDTLWAKTFGGPLDDGGASVINRHDGGNAVCGYTSSFSNGKPDGLLLKLDIAGNITESYTFGGAEEDSFNDLVQSNDTSGYVLLGTTKSYGAGGNDMYMIKSDNAGVKQWEWEIGAADNEAGKGVAVTSAGNYLVLGDNSIAGSDMEAHKFTPGGNWGGSNTFGDLGYEDAWDIKSCADGGYVLLGETKDMGYGYSDLVIIKTNSNYQSDSVSFTAVEDTSSQFIETPTPVNFLQSTNNGMRVYPNPNNGREITVIMPSFNACIFQLTDAIGRKIPFVSSVENNLVKLRLTNEIKGCYFLTAQHNNGSTEVIKLIFN